MVQDTENRSGLNGGPGHIKGLVKGVEGRCPLTRNLSLIRLDPSVTCYRNHLWTRTDGDRIEVGLDDLALKLLQPVMAWIGPASGYIVRSREHLVWAKNLGGMVSFASPFTVRVEYFNDKLYSSPHLPAESPYRDGFLLAVERDEHPGSRGIEPVLQRKVESWLQAEARRWETMVMSEAGLKDEFPGAFADGGNIINDPWIALGCAGMSKLLSRFFKPL